MLPATGTRDWVKPYLGSRLGRGKHRQPRFSQTGLVYAVKQVEQGIPVTEIARKHGVSEKTDPPRCKKHDGFSPSALKRLKDLERENGQLKKLVAKEMANRSSIDSEWLRLPSCAGVFEKRPPTEEELDDEGRKGERRARARRSAQQSSLVPRCGRADVTSQPVIRRRSGCRTHDMRSDRIQERAAAKE